MIRPVWTRQREHGGPGVIGLMIWLTLRLGWPIGQALLFPITAYFILRLPSARAASHAYLARVLGHAPRWIDTWRHFFNYACVLLDRICFLADRADKFRVRVAGGEHLDAAIATGTGCLLLGAHFGSFEVLRAYGRESPVPVKALMYRGTTGALSNLMEALDPAIQRDIIEIGAPDSMLRVRESLERGEIVGILADRAPAHDRAGGQRFAVVDFLGVPAAFPTGPLALAAALGVPVVLFFGLRCGSRDYRIVIEPFADRIALSRSDRRAELRDLAARYADRLASHCRASPFNWFNFYDFWEQQPDAATPMDTVRAAAVPGGGARGRAAIAAADR